MAYTAIDNPGEYFSTKLYTGNGGTLAVTGVGFQPDWVWIKSRPDARDSQIYDSVRGVTKVIGSDRTSAEATVSNGLTAFGSDGFTVGADANVNDNGDSHVAWNWKESATAGFDIVSFTTSGDDENFSHSLGVKPELIIFKARASSGNWAVLGEFTETTFNNKYMVLNLNDAQGSDGSYSNPTASQFSTSNQIAVDSTHIAYLFRSVQGYSKIGTYTGNGNADGTFVYTGFRPAWIITKKSNSAGNWVIVDTKRDGYNGANDTLQANVTDVESGGNRHDIVSNGFKARSTSAYSNSSGDTFIYMAFAENPFVNSNGVPGNAR